MTNEELTRKMMELDERVTRHTEQIKTVFNQIGEIKSLADGLHELVATVKVLANEQKETRIKVNDLAGDMEELKDKPAKRWDSIVTVAITEIVTAAITYALTRMGLK